MTERLRSWWKPTILVRVTNLGLGFILMTLVVAIGATNTGNNGLYILVSLFLATLLVSGVVSRRNVQKLSVALEGPPEIFAGEPARFTLKVKNHGRLPRRAILVRISGAASPVLFGRIGGGAEASRGVDLVFSKRGKRSVESLLVYSGYPIGLFRKGHQHPVSDERVIYPALLLKPPPPPDPRDAESGNTRARLKGRGPEIRHLRDASVGDDPRDVHWPQTARQGKFIIKERAAEEGHDAVVLLDVHRPRGADAGWGARFESAVSEAAGLSLQLMARGNRVGLVLGSQQLPRGVGPAHRRGLLMALALATESSEPSPPVPLRPGVAVYPLGPATRAGRVA